jgi:hypothetical protein
MNRINIFRIAVPALVCAIAAHAATITYQTPSGSTAGGGSVSATALVTTGAGTVSITLNNLQTNPTDVAQLISDFDFVLSNNATVGTLTSSTGPQITVNGGGTFTLGVGTPSTGWGLNNNIGGGLQLDALGFIGPAGLIIGLPGGATYSNANGSIAGNGPHNPFINQTATFQIAVTGVTASTTVTSGTFSFGTTAGVNVAGCVAGTVNCGASTVPEPVSLALTGSGLLGLYFIRRRSTSR